MIRLEGGSLYPLSYGVPVWERYGSTLLPATRESSTTKTVNKVINKGLKTYVCIVASHW